MFSEMFNGGAMKIVVASESRAGARDVYIPEKNGMAHRSYISPDSKWVLVVEMDSDGWLPCRVVPFEGGSAGRTVGPAPSQCGDAAWSPDGNWMYFAADVGHGVHLWRQRFPNGTPEQITFGATEEAGIAVAPDGKSLITSVGIQRDTVWLHDSTGDRQIATENHTFLPMVSPDGKKVYYLAHRKTVSGLDDGQLWSVNLRSGQQEHLLSDFLITRYSISRDGKDIVFAKAGAAGQSSLWLWSLDRSSPPRQLVSSDAYYPVFSGSGKIFFHCGDYVCRINKDGTNRQKVIPQRVFDLINVSPDGRWIVAATTTDGIIAYPVTGGPGKVLCKSCAAGSGDIGSPYVSWSSDGKFLFCPYGKKNGGASAGEKTVVFPLLPGHVFPRFEGDLINNPVLLKQRGVRVLDATEVFPGPSGGSVYAFWRNEVQRNLYRLSPP
jgi:eukaryotic-like serine/threonine-protein kinase